MSFEDIKLQPVYDSEEDNIVNDFYIPVLNESVEYLRLTGYFSSTALAIVARGISGLLENSGSMKIASGAVFSKRDVEAIKEGSENPEEIIKRNIINELNNIEDAIKKNHVSALAWLIAKKKLEIRIIIVKDSSGLPIDARSLEKSGIFHQKVGIFKDKNGNKIAFSGSVNETAFGWKRNIEEFNVFRSWINGEDKYFYKHFKKFEKYWNGEKGSFEVLDVPGAVKKKLINMAPKRIKDLKLEYIPQAKDKFKFSLTPWKHQIKAIEAFKKNNYFGIFKMATGTGKTYTALFALQDYFNRIKKYKNRIVIVLPQKNLVRQWDEDIRDFTELDDYILVYQSSTSESKKKFARHVWMAGFNKNSKSNIYLLITIGSIGNFKPIKKYQTDLIIGDEVHTYGTKLNTRILSNTFKNTKYKMGLSATPERYYDPDGTSRVMDNFGQVIFNYSIKEAQKDEILAKYYYFPFITYLSNKEEEELEELTSKISKSIAIDFRDEFSENENYLSSRTSTLIYKRANILKKAEKKMEILKDILIKAKDEFKQCIVYCLDSKQLDKVQNLFESLGIDSYVKYHYKIVNRRDALELFKINNCNFILSINCLNQGVDIPSCSSLILMSSSGNPREYIQRRGRVLRNPKDRKKPPVKIYDIFAFPQMIKENYKDIVFNRLLRAWEFISCSESPEAKIEFQDILDAYNISNDEIDSIIKEL